MKNIIGLFALIFACLISNIASAKAYESTQTNINNQPIKQKVEIKVKKKPLKYDFSLFKFVTPSQFQEKDTVEKRQFTPNDEVKDITFYEIPLTFFKFSYAS